MTEEPNYQDSNDFIDPAKLKNDLKKIYDKDEIVTRILNNISDTGFIEMAKSCGDKYKGLLKSIFNEAYPQSAIAIDFKVELRRLFKYDPEVLGLIDGFTEVDIRNIIRLCNGLYNDDQHLKDAVIEYKKFRSDFCD